MDRYVSVEEMITIEKASDASGHTYPQMMAHAGKSLADVVLETGRTSVLGLIGKGNNGGDALVAMSHLLDAGWSASAYCTGDRRNDPLVAEFLQKGGSLFLFSDDSEDYSKLNELVSNTEVILDGLLGTGIKLPLRPPVPGILSVVKEGLKKAQIRPLLIAVDCPSGADCDTGEVPPECLTADITVCMAAVKQGLLKLPAFMYLGELIVGGIGLPPDLPEWQTINRYVLDWDYVLHVLPLRPVSAHKGTFGTALIIAGSKYYAGAALLAGEAAFRSGTGWVKMAVPSFLHPHLVGHFKEATWLPLPAGEMGFTKADVEALRYGMDKETAILLGPGLGQYQEVEEFVRAFVQPDLPPMVVDADGLKLLSNAEGWWRRLPAGSILTPHPGEMSIITGLSVSEIQADRVACAENFANKWGCVIVLKGAFTVVAEPKGRTAILPVATPSLARAGTGDVLAGMIAGLRAQGMESFDAAAAGVWLHAQAGLRAANLQGSTAGVLAGDLLKALPSVMPY